MNHVHWWLFGLSFALGFVLTLALTVGPAKRQVASAKSEPSTTTIPVDPPTTRIPVEPATTRIPATERRTTTISVEPPTTKIPVEPATTRVPATERRTTKIPTVPPAPFGPGSAQPTLEGGGPAGWLVKGRADTRLYYTPDDPAYDATVADVWFKDIDSAARADFTPWRQGSKNR